MSKKNKHARNQAKYMERKREAGLEWLTEWVPAPAQQAFKAIAKAARKSHGVPSAARMADAEALASAQASELPEWARTSEVLLAVWMTSTVATVALDQVLAEREATKTKKAEAKAAKGTPAQADPATDSETEAGERSTQAAPPAPAKRARKPKAAPVVPTDPDLVAEAVMDGAPDAAVAPVTDAVTG